MGFGERLQREREMRGITLEEISASTKIGTRSLRALEKEDFDQLPGGVFNKGFVRAYAKYLGIDEEQAVADYVAAAGEAEQPLPQPLPVVQPPAVGGRRGLSSRLVVLLAALLLVGGGYAAYKYRPDLIGMAPPATEADLGEPVRDLAEEAENEEPPATTPGVVEAAAAAPMGTEPAPAAPETSPAAAGFTLQLNARQQSWVSIAIDGRPAEEFMLAGERTFQARNNVRLIVGNAGAVDLSHNGRALPPLGAADQRRSVTITAEGIQR